jgi:hypothetical protein
MVGISQLAITTAFGSNYGDLWAFIMTRLPRFVISSSASLFDSTLEVDPKFKLVKELIEHCIDNDENARLITQAIQALNAVADACDCLS